LIVTESLSWCIEAVIGANGDLFEDQFHRARSSDERAHEGIVVAAGAICVAVLLFTVSLDSSPDQPAGAKTPVETSAAASSGPVAFPNSGRARLFP
jgi:hypothetical protein